MCYAHLPQVFQSVVHVHYDFVHLSLSQLLLAL